jgi:hypothetical protein
MYCRCVNTRYLYISLKDNSPNVNLEAAACPKCYIVNFGTTQEHYFFYSCPCENLKFQKEYY